MVLPPYVYKGDWRETERHFAAVISATPLPCMLYNNPIAYGTDFLPEQVRRAGGGAPQPARGQGVERRRPPRHRAHGRSSGDRLALLVGVDDLIVEGIAAGAVGWIAGLVNALARRSRSRLFDLAGRGHGPRRRARSTSGSCRCCGSTPCRSSCS